MNGFIFKWDPESQTGEIHSCPDNRFFSFSGDDNPSTASQLDALFPDGLDSDEGCPGSVQVRFNPPPSDDAGAQSVVITSQPVGDAHTLALQASSHALSASRHVDALSSVEGVQPKTLAAAHAAATAAHSAAASALAAAAQQKAATTKRAPASAAPPKKSPTGRKRR